MAINFVLFVLHCNVTDVRVPFEHNDLLADTEGTVHGAVVEKKVTTHTQECCTTTSNNVQQKSSGLLICLFVAFLSSINYNKSRRVYIYLSHQYVWLISN